MCYIKGAFSTSLWLIQGMSCLQAKCSLAGSFDARFECRVKLSQYEGGLGEGGAGYLHN